MATASLRTEELSRPPLPTPPITGTRCEWLETPPFPALRCSHQLCRNRFFLMMMETQGSYRAQMEPRKQGLWPGPPTLSDPQICMDGNVLFHDALSALPSQRSLGCGYTEPQPGEVAGDQQTAQIHPKEGFLSPKALEGGTLLPSLPPSLLCLSVIPLSFIFACLGLYPEVFRADSWTLCSGIPAGSAQGILWGYRGWNLG